MNKRKIIFLLIASLSNCKIKAQDFMQSAGGTVALMSARISTPAIRETLSLVLTDVTYFPRLNLSQTSKSSFSVGVPLSTGIGIISDAYNGDGVYLSVDAPLVADYNSGCKSTKENKDDFGWYAGAGFGYTYTAWTNTGIDTYKANSYGPLVRAGVRLGFPSFDQGLTFGAYFKQGLEHEKFKTLGFNALIDF